MPMFKSLFWFTVPALALYLLLSIYPLLSGLQISLTDSTGVSAGNWVGLENFFTFFRETKHLKAIVTTLQYSLVVVVFQNVFGLALATLLDSLPAVRNQLRVFLLLPSMFSTVIAGFVWTYLYSPLGGGINEMLNLLNLDSWQQIWLGDPSIALFAVAAVHVWMYSGYSAAIFLAGFLNIPVELRDAAKIDGANAWQRFWRLDLPMLAPAITVNVTLSTIGTLRAFELPLVMTNGGPARATDTLGYQVYTAMIGDFRFGLAAAISIVLLFLVLIVAGIQNMLLRVQENKL
jgi:raffinose/stachyose/melibiose transport system permease protein